MPATINRSNCACPVGPPTSDPAHLRNFEKSLQWGAIRKIERKEIRNEKLRKQAIANYRRNLDRISLGTLYAKNMGVPLISVLAALDESGGNKIKNAICKLRTAMTIAKFGLD